ncbi:hypothetical protein BMR10_03605, partial [Methylococcaceae bacterium CS4]
MDAGRIRASQILISPVKLLPRTWAWTPKMSFRKSRDSPTVRFVNKVFLDAIKKGASDIHLEPYEKSFRIRFRNDGMLSEISSPPVNI